MKRIRKSQSSVADRRHEFPNVRELAVIGIEKLAVSLTE
jgi:hypothetical protein